MTNEHWMQLYLQAWHFDIYNPSKKYYKGQLMFELWHWCHPPGIPMRPMTLTWIPPKSGYVDFV